MRRFVPLVLSIVLLGAATDTPPSPRGFFEENLDAQHKPEREFLALPDPAVVRETMRRLAAAPHHVGSPRAEERRVDPRQVSGVGLDAQHRDVRRPLPDAEGARSSSSSRPTRSRRRCAEPPLADDPTSGQTAEQLPTYNAYSHRRRRHRAARLRELRRPRRLRASSSASASTSRARSSSRATAASWRGIKPKVAAEHGAVGCLIYSDPRDDGYFAGRRLPEGRRTAREQGVQRGSVADMPLYPGDPLTPGVGATKDAKRLDARRTRDADEDPGAADLVRRRAAAARGARRPGRARRLARRAADHVSPRPGPGEGAPEARVRLGARSRSTTSIATHAGQRPGPTSGSSAATTTTRGSTAPRIRSAAWSRCSRKRARSARWRRGLEAEAHDRLRRVGRRGAGAARLDRVGRDARGRAAAEGRRVHQHRRQRPRLPRRRRARTARDVRQRGGARRRGPGDEASPSGSALQRRRSRRRGTPDDRKEARERPDLRIDALGSGSDYTPFLQHLGIASLNLGFGGEDDGGIYHSIYDDFDQYTRFGDTDFAYGARARARRRAARAAPRRRRRPAVRVHGSCRHGRPLRRRDRRAREQEAGGDRKNGICASRKTCRAAVADPKKPFVAAEAARRAAALRLRAAAERVGRADGRARRPTRRAYDAAFASGAARRHGGASLPPSTARWRSSSAATPPRAGLPGRPWFRHYVYAPGFYTGYGVKTLPAVREAIEERRWDDVNPNAEATAKVIARAAAQLQAAAKLLASPEVPRTTLDSGEGAESAFPLASVGPRSGPLRVRALGCHASVAHALVDLLAVGLAESDGAGAVAARRDLLLAVEDLRRRRSQVIPARMRRRLGARRGRRVSAGRKSSPGSRWPSGYRAASASQRCRSRGRRARRAPAPLTASVPMPPRWRA